MGSVSQTYVSAQSVWMEPKEVPKNAGVLENESLYWESITL